MKYIKLLAICILFVLSFQYCHSENNSGDPNSQIYTEAKNTNTMFSGQGDEISNSRQNAITRAVNICSPAIVGINVTEVHQVQYRDPFDSFFDDPFFQHFFGNQRRSRTQQYSVQGLGSGFLISPDGYILTNHHVAGNASKIVVTTTDGKKYDAEIIGADKTSDVALLKIKGDNFPYLKLANSDDVIIGEWAIAFGNPFGLFDINTKPTVTVGVISNKNINFTQDDRVYKGMLQTDAAISSGNSGGPLVNSNGEVIGINTVIFSTAQNSRGAGSIGIGFSIPINRVKKVVDIIKDKKKINRNFNVGMEVRDVDESLAPYISSKVKEGVVVYSIIRNSPAEESGFETGDIILEINGQPITKADDYLVIVYDGTVGQQLNFTLLRDDKKITKTLILKPFGR
ncbi:MAG: trypsin-like peptidase domain-containing protein [Ignavibacteriae bacterium]|nr:trypsin-like peptidase domain-containing protein [Ignavibacteriota bacterium]